MERLKRIGFDKLVDICCSQIYRDFCGELIRVFDPVSRQILIRGKTHLVGPEDVNELMGLPFKGEDIKINVENEDETFKKLRSDYEKVPYKTIGTWLIEGKEEEKFEFLFVMYALGVLLCPGSSVWVSDKVLKVIVVTKDSLGHYDWSSLVLKEFCNSIAEFKKGRRKEKLMGRKMWEVVIYYAVNCLCIEKAAKNENAITYWDEEKVKARVKSEKNSDRGILHGVPSVGGASTSASNTGIKLTHPEIKRTYERLMTMVEGLVSTIGEELVSLQLRLTDEIDKEDVVEAVSSEDDKEKATEDEETGEEGKGSPKDSILSQEEQQSEPEGDDKEEGKSASREEESQSQPEEKGEGSHSGSEDDGEEKTQDKSSDAAAEEDKGVGDEMEEKDEMDQQAQGQMDVRRSTRVRSRAIKSPWLEEVKKGRGKRKADEKEELFQMCTRRCDQDEGAKYIVEMYGYFLTRAELCCLQDRKWMNDRFMSMVARTLVGDEKENHSRVSRHIFTPELMQTMAANPLRWSMEKHEHEILPEHIGYNIGDCDFIFGPTLFNYHWFCYVMDVRTMRFYALDSLVDNLTMLRLQREEEEAMKTGKKPQRKQGKKRGQIDPKQFMARGIRDCFCQVLRVLKPSLFAEEDKIDEEVTWAKVHVQSDTDSCGVHVLSWLQTWDGTEYGDDGYTMPKYSPEEIHDLKVGCLWWLVTHRNNLHGDEVLSLLRGNPQSKRKK
ncbi:uncharacterized protein LOC114737057 [Neltuma alba]|uniref:uncharacterized protein LOC114737057 n=1 Tax=Neltuma alba TaxID=207710 RepID=UPI0010A2AEC4|nr:uncharacterized protein LOC114737057 [Prosopis alba]